MREENKGLVHLLHFGETEMQSVAQATEILDSSERRVGYPPLEPESSVQPMLTRHGPGEAHPALKYDARLLSVDRDRSATANQLPEMVE